MRPATRESLLCEVVNDRFGWFDKGVVYDNARLVVDDTNPSEFFSIFCQALNWVEYGWVEARRECTISQSIAYTRERCLSSGRTKIESETGWGVSTQPSGFSNTSAM